MKTEIYWKAIVENDARFNGAFFYGVNSTGIYCRPSCSSRLPKRENVSFFDSLQTAESKGFRACLRCRPKDAGAAHPQTETVLRAARFLDEDEQLSLADLSARLDLSAAHLQKIFKEIIGVSPKKYAQNRRIEKFKDEIKKGSAVTDAMYEAGFGSSSRLYENVSEKLGMTPKTYAKKGQNMKISYTIADSEIGKMLVARTAKGVCAVMFGDNESALMTEFRGEYANAEISENKDDLKDTVAAVLANLAGKNKTLDLPLDVQATAFQMRVWELLRKIPYGETATYTDIAERLGTPQSVRAVASACAANRAALVVPCHRVVGKNGKLSGYRWGIERKKKILEREA